jgi:hypothetical protein
VNPPTQSTIHIVNVQSAGGAGGFRVAPGATACGGGEMPWHGSKHCGWVLIGSGLEEREKAQLK